MSIFKDDTAIETKAKELGFTNVNFNWDDNSVTLEKIAPYPVGGTTLVWRSKLTIVPEASFTAISTESYIQNLYRNSGQGDRKHKATLETAKAGGLKTLLCTVNNTNWPQLAILFKNRWKAVTKISDQSTLWKKEL